MASDVPWVPTIVGAIAGAAAPITAYWFTREGGNRPKLEAEAQRFAFEALSQVTETRGDEIERLSALVTSLHSEVEALRAEVARCELKHDRAKAALASHGIVVDD